MADPHGLEDDPLTNDVSLSGMRRTFVQTAKFEWLQLLSAWATANGAVENNFTGSVYPAILVASLFRRVANPGPVARLFVHLRIKPPTAQPSSIFMGLVKGFHLHRTPLRFLELPKWDFWKARFCRTWLNETIPPFRPDVRFIPYIQIYEFEGLLFSDPAALSRGMFRTDLELRLQAIRDGFGSPEDINDSYQTAPSKRILQLDSGYDKVISGALAAEEMGIDVIKAQCPRFNGWFEKLASLGSAT